jgi:hypothetical protein
VIHHPSTTHGWLRLAGLFIGACLFIWIPFEDLGLHWVLILSATICGWMAFRVLLNCGVRGWRKVLWHALVGSLAGLSVALLATLLMLMKSGLHGHGTPDFTVDQIITVFELAPNFLLSGLLIGLGFGVWRAAR